jgi:hypothetical protein
MTFDSDDWFVPCCVKGYTHDSACNPQALSGLVNLAFDVAWRLQERGQLAIRRKSWNKGCVVHDREWEGDSQCRLVVVPMDSAVPS